jgi:tetratricopeptide (TPR) repeat protein
MLHDIVDKTAQRIESDLKEQPEVQAELGLVLTEVYFQLQDYDLMEEMARKTLVLSRNQLGAESLPAADALSLRAGALMVLRRTDEAEVAVRQAIILQQKLRGANSVQEADALRCLSRILIHQSTSSVGAKSQELKQQSARLARRALAIYRKRYGEDHEEIAWALQNLASILGATGKLDEAEEAVRQAIEIRIRLHGELHPYLASDYSALGIALIRQDKLDAAEASLRKALELGDKMGIEGKNLHGRVHDTLAYVLLTRGNPVEAEQHLRESVTIMRKEMGVDYPDLPAYLCSLATTLQQNGNLDEARAAAQEALDICNRNPDSIPDPLKKRAVKTLASILSAQGDTAALKTLDREAMEPSDVKE